MLCPALGGHCLILPPLDRLTLGLPLSQEAVLAPLKLAGLDRQHTSVMQGQGAHMLQQEVTQANVCHWLLHQTLGPKQDPLVHCWKVGLTHLCLKPLRGCD
jgi:hypothetical protein